MANEHLKSALTVKQFSGDLQKYQSLIEKLLPRYFPSERMVNLAVTAFMQNATLRQCSMLSIVNSVCVAAQLGLEPNTSLGHGWLIPYKQICQFQPGYRGLIHLALQSPRVHNVSAHVVYQEDEFSLSYGTDGALKHVPNIEAPSQAQLGQWLGAYALLKYREGPPEHLFMAKWEIEKTRASSVAYRNGKQDSPWFQWPEEMWRKTVIKRLIKYAELSPLSARAIGYDDQSEAGKMQDPVIDVDYSVLDEQMNPEAQVDPKVEQARKEAGKPAEPGGEGLKQRLKATAKEKIPIFGSKHNPVEWPESYDGPALVWNGERYEFDREAGNYRKVGE